MRYIMVCAVFLVIMCSSSLYAGILDGTDAIGGTFYENSKTSAALAIRVPFDSDGDISGLLIDSGKENLKGNVGKQVVGVLTMAVGYGIKQGGVYAVAPIATYDGTGVSTDLDTINLRLGLGAQLGSATKRVHIAVTWNPSDLELKPDGVFVGFTLLSN